MERIGMHLESMKLNKIFGFFVMLMLNFKTFGSASKSQTWIPFQPASDFVAFLFHNLGQLKSLFVCKERLSAAASEDEGRLYRSAIRRRHPLPAVQLNPDLQTWFEACVDL